MTVTPKPHLFLVSLIPRQHKLLQTAKELNLKSDYLLTLAIQL